MVIITDQLPQPRAKRVPQGWRVPQWAEGTTLSDAYVRTLVKSKRIRSVKAGSARIILTTLASISKASLTIEAA